MSGDAPQPPEAYRDYVTREHEELIICGQAVNLWAGHYLDSASPELAPLHPFVSKDVDILGDEATYARMKSIGTWQVAMQIKAKNAGPLLDVVGALTAVRADGTKLAVEIRRSVHGLSGSDLERATHVEKDGTSYVVMEPQIVLKGKLANLADISQEGRQDGRHIRMLIPCVRRYLEDNHAQVVAGTLSPSSLLDRISETREILCSPHAANAVEMLGVSFNTVISPQLLLSPNPEIKESAAKASSSIALHLWRDQSPHTAHEVSHQQKPEQGEGLSI